MFRMIPNCVILPGMKTDGRTLDHQTLEHLRFTALSRYRAGEKVSVIATSLGFHRASVYKWIKLASTGGRRALRSRPTPGASMRLSEEQQRKVKRMILGKDPRDYGYDTALWSLRIISDLIKEMFSITLSRVSVRTLLGKLDITPQKPLRRAYERNPEAVEEWKGKTLPKIVKRAKKHNALLLFLDEAAIQSDASLGGTWGATGKRTVVRTSGQRQRVSAVSAVAPTGEFKCEIYTNRFNAAFFIEILKTFSSRVRRKCIFIVDSHPAHRAKKVKEFVASTAGKIELVFLPPYAPDLNPDEFVWNYIKRNGTSKRPLKKNESLRARAKTDFENLKKNRGLVKSFFYAESVAYPT